MNKNIDLLQVKIIKYTSGSLNCLAALSMFPKFPKTFPFNYSARTKVAKFL